MNLIKTSLLFLCSFLLLGCALDGNTLKFKFQRDREILEENKQKIFQQKVSEILKENSRRYKAYRQSVFDFDRCTNNFSKFLDYSARSWRPFNPKDGNQYDVGPHKNCWSVLRYKQVSDRGARYNYKNNELPKLYKLEVEKNFFDTAMWMCSLKKEERKSHLTTVDNALANLEEQTLFYEKAFTKYNSEVEEYNKKLSEADEFLEKKCKRKFRTECDWYRAPLTGATWQECEQVFNGFACVGKAPQYLDLRDGSFNMPRPKDPGDPPSGWRGQNTKRLNALKEMKSRIEKVSLTCHDNEPQILEDLGPGF